MLHRPAFCFAAIVTTALFSSLLSEAAAQDGGTWATLSPLQTPRQEIGAARIGNRVFVVGGLVEEGVPTPTVEVYDIRRNRWSPAPPLPRPLDHIGVAALGGRLYVVGGFSADRSARAESYVFDPQTARWTQIASLPAPRGAPWAVGFRGRLYVFGGTDRSQDHDSTFIYDPQTDRWSQGAPMPTAREHLNAVVHGRFLYVVGGRSAGSTPVLERYDPATDRWRSLRPMPTARSAAAVATFGDKVYVMGGETPQLFAVNEVYDPLTDSWSVAAPMPVPRHGVAAVTLDQAILVPGGGIVQGLLPSSHVDAFFPQPPPMPGEAGQVGFASDVLLAAEDGGPLSVAVVREGGSSGPLAVEWSTEDLGAAAGVDYSAGSGRLEWPDGDAEPKSFPIEPLDDDIEEASELLRLVLTPAPGFDEALLNDSAAIVLLDDDRPAGCRPDAQTLCLLDRRFGVEVVWRDPRSGASGVASSLEELDQTGIFWFFAPDNFELLVKVLDGRAINGHFWLFYGALSDVEYWIVAADTLRAGQGEAVRVFHNPPLRLASFADVDAFPGASLGGDPSDLEQGRPFATHQEEPDGASDPCRPDDVTLCLLEGRFRIEVTWQALERPASAGRALPRTDESGLFWFFQPENVELAVKVLDGRAINGHFWLFYGALSDVSYTLTVTDTSTGESKQYVNDQGTLASVADVTAFGGSQAQ